MLRYAFLLEYADNEKDLGVDITSNFSYNGHCDKIISRANQKLGMLRRTCNFATTRNICHLLRQLVKFAVFLNKSQSEKLNSQFIIRALYIFY